MRTLTSVQSSTNVITDLEFHLKASDQSQTWIFAGKDIISLSGLNSEISFGGGFGKPSNYNITLNTSMGFIGSQFSNIVRGETSIKVYVNSDNFTPHIGRVRDIDRRAENPNELTLRVYDRFLDNNPLFPAETIADSYSTVHPSVLNVDMGYPVYYGKHARPFYMTPVDCDLGSLIGPRNVSSENHVTSLWYQTDVACFVLLSGGWPQQSGGTNISSNTYPFEIHDRHVNDSHVMNITNIIQDPNVESATTPLATNKIQGATCEAIPVRFAQVVHGARMKVQAGVDFVKNSTKIFYSSKFETITTSIILHTVFLVTTSSDVQRQILLKQTQTPTITDSSLLVDSMDVFLLGNVDHHMVSTLASSHNITDKVTFSFSADLYVQLQSKAYKNHSIVGTQINCSDVALSENPIFILTDIYSQSSINYISQQASQSQFDASSYNFQCYFDQRQTIKDISHEFGQISGTYAWVGDSGFVNFRTYQESATIQDSSLIDFTITTSDILRNSLRIKDNPLGVTVYETKKTKRVKIDYDFNFSTKLYNSTLTADPSNNAFCESAQAGGISDEITKKTKYILESDTTSLYLQNVIRQTTQDESILEMSLPARFFQTEITDVCKVQHPAIIGSESLYQVVSVDHDYINGEVKLKLYEILNL